MGMVRDFLVSSCAPDWRWADRIAADLHSRLDDDAMFLTESLMLNNWVLSLVKYCSWWEVASVDFSLPVETELGKALTNLKESS